MLDRSRARGAPQFAGGHSTPAAAAAAGGTSAAEAFDTSCFGEYVIPVKTPSALVIRLAQFTMTEDLQ